jgi:tetratricopeptide (TPR) repeat protein
MWDDIVKKENIYPLLETRLKTLIASGDNQAAVQCADELVLLDPYDPKALLEHGNCCFRQGDFRRASTSFLTAALLGPPATEVSLFLASESFSRLGESLWLKRLGYQLGVSIRERYWQV